METLLSGHLILTPQHLVGECGLELHKAPLPCRINARLCDYRMHLRYDPRIKRSQGQVSLRDSLIIILAVPGNPCRSDPRRKLGGSRVVPRLNRAGIVSTRTTRNPIFHWPSVASGLTPKYSKKTHSQGNKTPVPSRWNWDICIVADEHLGEIAPPIHNSIISDHFQSMIGRSIITTVARGTAEFQLRIRCRNVGPGQGICLMGPSNSGTAHRRIRTRASGRRCEPTGHTKSTVPLRVPVRTSPRSHTRLGCARGNRPTVLKDSEANW
ncbi:hypothetical protein GQ607_010701 [Colletotrichum asianum]|uniref:Uncharacterized protein n=1 Tax=Colletotrichum asianum TaxID=702518 RepID=A0A8H3W8X9_9PEZI|nr:hypothetical protein GQ607_010701 [Colletotrichum asianum]